VRRGRGEGGGARQSVRIRGHVVIQSINSPPFQGRDPPRAFTTPPGLLGPQLWERTRAACVEQTVWCAARTPATQSHPQLHTSKTALNRGSTTVRPRYMQYLSTLTLTSPCPLTLSCDLVASCGHGSYTCKNEGQRLVGSKVREKTHGGQTDGRTDGQKRIYWLPR